LWPDHLASGNQKRFLARFCEAGGGFGDGIDSALNPLEAFSLYPLFYPPVEKFRHYLSEREIMRFSRFT